MDKNDYDLLDDTRHAAIDAAANLLARGSREGTHGSVASAAAS